MDSESEFRAQDVYILTAIIQCAVFRLQVRADDIARIMEIAPGSVDVYLSNIRKRYKIKVTVLKIREPRKIVQNPEQWDSKNVRVVDNIIKEQYEEMSGEEE